MVLKFEKMKDIKIYISLREAESLVFNKILVLQKYREGVERAQKDWSIAIYLKHEPIRLKEDYLLILSGNINYFEIPAKEESLFFNHFKIPKGLYRTVDRKYRDDKKSIDAFDHTAENILTDEKTRVFKGIRRGLLQCLQLAFNKKIDKNFDKVVIDYVNDFENLDSFHLDFIKEVIKSDFYPFIQVRDGHFHTEAFNRFVWIGKYTVEYLSSLKSYSQEEVEEGRAWLRQLSDKENVDLIVETTKNYPLILEEHYEFLLGYYIAASFYEESKVGEGYYFYLEQILDKFRLGKNKVVLFWAIFFQSIFKDEIDFLYFLPSIQKEQEIIEKKIVSIVLNNIEIDSTNIELPRLNEDNRLIEYIQLIKGGELKELKKISAVELRDLYKNNISQTTFKTSGFEFKSSIFSLNLIRNKCSLDKNGFLLNLHCKPNVVTFYLSKNSEVEEWLKNLKIKTKPIEKLIDSSKKALVSFIEGGGYDHRLLKFYEYLINELKHKELFKEVVIVLMIDKSLEYVQSVEFQREKLDFEAQNRSVFGNNCHVLVKNLQNSSDGEIKRNLKHILEKYQPNQIELVDENIDDTILEWMISISNEYILETEIHETYSIINL